jgi:hemolysin activation/secretion protein
MHFNGLGANRLALASVVAVSALTPVIVPQVAFAQAVGVPTRDDLKGVTAQPTAPAPRLSIAGGIERSACTLADPQYQDIKITISEVMFNGLKGMDAKALEPVWKPYAGQPQPIAALCDIRDAAGTVLRDRGFLAAVQVPTQRIEDGKVRLEVLYARITAIRARGETRGAEAKLQAYLGHLAGDEIFDRNKAERYLLLARDLPGYNVQLTLKPAGTAAGDLIGEVTVLREPYAVDFTVQNLSADSTGPFGGQLRVQFFGLTGMGDATSLSYYATPDFKEQHIFQAAHEFRPGSNGLVLGGQLTYALTKPDLGAAGGGLRLDARTLYASLNARYPLRRAQAGNTWLSGGFDLVNQDVDLVGPLTRDKLRVLWTRLDFDQVDVSRSRPAWRAAGSLELRQGLDILSATRTCIGAGCAGSVPTSRFDGSPGATVVRASAEYERVFGRISFLLAPRGQYAFKPLLSFEEFSAGNYTIGRGYDPGALIGDSGVGSALELRGPRLPLSQDGTMRVQPYVFADAAWVWNKGVPGSQHLTSVGGGVRSELGSRFRLDATLAVPLQTVGLQTSRGKPRFLVTFTTRLLPWRTN